MHIVQGQGRQRVQKRMYLASERRVVNGVGLGELDGLFNIGKMFSRLTTFTPSSFKLSNIMGAVGSLTAFTVTGGLSTLLPKTTGAHAALMKDVGMATVAVAAAAGGAAALSTGAAVPGAAAGSGVLAPVAQASYFTMPAFETAGSAMTAGTGVLAPAAEAGGGFFSAVGSGLSTVGSGLMKAVQALPMIGQVFGGGGGGQPQQQVQAQVDSTQTPSTADQIAQIAAQQAAMYQPGYAANVPYVTGPPTVAPSMDSSYGDLRSPYTAVTEDGNTVQVDPATGQVVQAGMIPDLSMGTWLAIGGATLVGWYLMSGSEKK